MRHPEFKKVSPKQEWLRLGIKLVVLVLIFWIILGVLFGIRRIEGVAMDPKVSDGDLSLFFRTNDNLEAGDVVLFSKDDKQYVSRIIGVEDDVISLDEEGHLYLNGEEFSEIPAYNISRGDEVTMSYPYRVEKDTFFVINDNLDSKGDSREYGAIKKETIYGKVISILRTRDI